MSTVLHVITGLGAGGAETMLTQLATSLQRQGMPQSVVSLKGRGAYADILEAEGIPVIALGITRPANAVPRLTPLLSIASEIRPDVIQGWMYHGNIAALLAHSLSAHRARRRLFWNIRASNMDARRYKGIMRWNARLSSYPDLIIVNSEAGRDFHESIGLPASRMEVVPNGVDTEKFRPLRALRTKCRAELGIPKDAVVAMLVARVDDMKDHHTFFAAMERLPQLYGLLVGRGTQALALPRNVRALGLRDDVARLHAAADIIVSSSAFGEGFSNAIAEGMASGLVPVVTDVGDSARIVGESGQVVEPGDPEALARAIAKEAERPTKERQARARAARERIVRNFTLESAVERYKQIYSTVDLQA